MENRSREEQERKCKADRLKKVCDYLIEKTFAKNYRDLAEILGYQTDSSFSHVLSGRKSFLDKRLIKLETFFPQLNVQWIIKGEGKMLKSETGEDNSIQLKCIDRFVRYLYANNIQIRDALARLNWQRRAYDKALRSELTDRQIQEIARVFEDLNMDWLVHGIGSMERVKNESFPSVLQQMQRRISILEKRINQLERRLKNVSSKIE